MIMTRHVNELVNYIIDESSALVIFVTWVRQ